jgi:hypothetical protein
MAITGGVTGIGRAIAIGYLTHGANVAVNHFGDPKSSEQFQTLLDEASQSLGGKEAAQKRLIEVPGDVGDPETGKKLVTAVVEKWGRLDVFISNAGICKFREFLEYVHHCAHPSVILTPPQNHTRALERDPQHQPHWRIQHHPRRRHPALEAISPRRLHYRHIQHISSCWWRAAGSLHAHQSRYHIAPTIVCLRSRQVQYQVQCIAAGHDQDATQREGLGGRRQEEVHGRPDTTGTDGRACGSRGSSGVFRK